MAISSTAGYAQSAGGTAPALASPDRAAEPPGPARQLGLRLPISGFAASSDSAGRAYSVTLRPADHGRLITTIEYRMAPRGPIGSFGLQTSGDGPHIPLYELNSAAAMEPGGPAAKVGARVSYHF